MTTKITGWNVSAGGHLTKGTEDGRCCVLAKSCGHFLIAFADTRCEAW